MMEDIDFFEFGRRIGYSDEPAYIKEERKYELQMPIRRPFNDDETDDFVAIDFECMTPLKTSACAIGMVKVMDGEIVQRFYSLINPVRDKDTEHEPFKRIHGISLETAEKAPTFEELFEGIKLIIGELPIVCHNKSADIANLRALMEFYHLEGLNLDTSICTYHLTKLSLKEACKHYEISLPEHHDALCDAEACAKIYLAIIGKPLKEVVHEDHPFGKSRKPSNLANRKISSCHRVQLSDEEIKYKDTPFYQAKVVITGTFSFCRERDEIACQIQHLGGKIISGISKQTDIVVMGRGAGSSKLEKIKQLQEAGHTIRTIEEYELREILNILQNL